MAIYINSSLEHMIPCPSSFLLYMNNWLRYKQSFGEMIENYTNWPEGSLSAILPVYKFNQANPVDVKMKNGQKEENSWGYHEQKPELLFYYS